MKEEVVRMRLKVLLALVYGAGVLGGAAIVGGPSPLRFAVLVVAPPIIVIVLTELLALLVPAQDGPMWNAEERQSIESLHQFFRESWSAEGGVELTVAEAHIVYRLIADELAPDE